MSSLIKSLISIGLLVISSFISVQNSEAAYSISKVGGTYTYTPGNYTGLTVNGEFSVDALGDANYSIPLKVPKGSNSFHPSLGLHYNSSNTKHILGIGWSLTGVSKISRCASNIAQDGKIRGIRFDSQDKFCIDGQKLKLSSGTYGANGATYVTEMHSFSKITSNGVAGSGPQSFTVISDDGTVTVYGGTVDSRQIATGKSEVFVWSVSSITNSMGSKIDFIYEGDIYESRIKEITYGGATHDFNKVSFHYLDDPNGQVRSYLAGSEFQLKKVLQTIKGYRGGVVEPIIQYNLVYNFASPNITALTSIEECHNSIGTLSCLPKVEFIGGTLDQSFSNETPWSGSHFVSDTGGSYDRINEYKFFAEEHFLHDDESTGEVSGLADLNGDGLVDFFRPQSNLIGLNTGSSFVQTAWSNSTFLYPDADNKTGANDTTPEEPVIALVSNSLKRYKKEVIYGQRLNEPPTVATDMGVIDINGDGLPDLVRPNLPNPVRLNNGNGFDSEIAWPNANALSQGLPFTACYAGCISYSGTDFTNPKIIHRSYIDMNGDGLVDAYAPDLDPYGSTPNLWLNNGSGFDSPIRLNPPDPTRPYISKHDADGLGFDGPISGYFDMNGDGLVDFVDAERNGGTVWLNTGNGFTSALVWTFPSQAGGHINKEYYGSGYINNQSMLMDMNADGLPDIINLSTNEVCYNMGTHFQTTCESWGATLSSDFYGSLSTTDHNGVYRGATLQTMMAVNGDGLPDFLRVQESGGVTKLMINQNKPISRYIHKIYNGKNTITINYKHLSDPSMNYVKTASNSSSKYVVESFETEDGIGGIYKRVYSYKNLLFDRFGRGLKGFEEVTTKDLNAKTRSVVKYKQSWPYTGSVEHTWEYAGTDTSGDNGKLIKETIQDWDTMNIVDGATTSVFNYIKKSEEKDYEYNHAVPATPTRHTITDFVYYPNGYIDTTTESYGNGFTDTKLTKVVYYSTANNISGKPDTVTVTFNGVTSEQRQSKFYYYSHGQLQKEVVQPGGGADIELSTEYLYDSFGNRTTTTAKASGELDRISITGYDPQGIYATTQTNPKGHLSQTFYTSRGLVDYTLDVNGFKTKFTYDDFGRVRFSTVFDGLTNALTTETQYKDADIGPVSAYYIKSIAPDGTYSIQWFDYFDRIVRKLSKSFNQTVCVDTVYNNKGQITHVSDPTDCLDTTTTLTNPLYTQTYYDDAGRVYDTILPDGTTTRTSYNGLNTTVTADYLGKNQSTTTEKNQKGQIVKVTDPLNHYKTFTYNKFGNLTGIISTSSDDITMIYDRLGRKTSMTDVNLGTWEYKYNAFGELKKQWDGPALTTGDPTVELAYDVLGRVVTRIEKEGTTTWEYDDPTKTKGIGKLARVYNNGNFINYSKTELYYDSYGRAYQTDKTIGLNTYTSTNEYDSLHRLYKHHYPGGFITEYSYSNGVNHEIWHAGTGKLLWRLDTRTPYGQIKKEYLADNLLGTPYLTLDYTYYSQTHLLDTIVANAGGSIRQNQKHVWDAVGNFKSRQDLLISKTETFGYDNNNRLTSSQIGATNKIFSYASNGNIDSKDGQTYSYDPSKDHAVSSVYNPGTQSYTYYNYDGNGNCIKSGDKSIYYYSFNKPRFMKKPDMAISFVYDHDRKLVSKRTRTKQDINNAHRYKLWRQTEYVNPQFEVEIKFDSGNSEKYYKNYVVAGGRTIAVVRQKMALHSTTIINTEYNYFLKDHLGSTIGVLDENMNVITGTYGAETHAFDPWGKRRTTSWGDSSTELPGSSRTDRGYTSHKDIEDFGFIHMGGRVYDPSIGRFLSPDPFIQNPYDTQQNRYSYVRNNPMTATDPSGYFLKWLGRKIKKHFGLLVSAFLPANPFWAGFLGGAAGSAINGGNIWKGAITSGISASAFQWAGHGPGSGVSRANMVRRHFAAGALSGGVNSVIHGGSFGDGFLSGGMSAGLAARFGNSPNKGDSLWRKVRIGAGRMVLGGIGGGISAKIYGGSFNAGFQSGAETAGFAYVFNEVAGVEMEARVAERERGTSQPDFGDNMSQLYESAEEYILGIDEAKLWNRSLKLLDIAGNASAGKMFLGAGLATGNPALMGAGGIFHIAAFTNMYEFGTGRDVIPAPASGILALGSAAGTIRQRSLRAAAFAQRTRNAKHAYKARPLPVVRAQNVITESLLLMNDFRGAGNSGYAVYKNNTVYFK